MQVLVSCSVVARTGRLEVRSGGNGLTPGTLHLSGTAGMIISNSDDKSRMNHLFDRSTETNLMNNEQKAAMLAPLPAEESHCGFHVLLNIFCCHCSCVGFFTKPASPTRATAPNVLPLRLAAMLGLSVSLEHMPAAVGAVSPVPAAHQSESFHMHPATLDAATHTAAALAERPEPSRPGRCSQAILNRFCKPMDELCQAMGTLRYHCLNPQ